MFFALVETQGNQPYVFSSNREKAIRGASELLFRSTTDWVIDAVSGSRAERDFQGRAAFLRGQNEVGLAHSVIVATSGRAVVIGPDRARLESVVSSVTSRALREAPGMLVAGAVVPLDLDDVKGFDASFHLARTRLSSNITAIGPRNSRSATLPFLRPCDETGLAASERDRAKNRSVSNQFHAQSIATSSSRSRLESLAGDNFAAAVDDVTGDDSWRAVMHADGNGIGRIFGSLCDLFAQEGDGRQANVHHMEGYREFSLALEYATEQALLEATTSLGDGSVMPILLGGDDIIVQVSAHRAIDFACAYLMAFEKHSEEAVSVLRSYARPGSALPDRLTSSAGVSIVKAGFSFSSASDLAAQLLESAKRAKNEGRTSSVDIHVSYDSTSADLETIRSMRTSSDGLRLWGGPYVIGRPESTVARSISVLQESMAALSQAKARSQIQQMKEAARKDRAALTIATTNALHVSGSDSPRSRAIETLAAEHDGHVVLIDALELADISRKAGGR